MKKLFERTDVLDETGHLYLRRYDLIRTPWFCVYLHKINSSDKDRDRHNHPYASFSFLLGGNGYIEESEEARHVKPWSFNNLLNRHRPHRIRLINNRPQWTLFFRGPWREDWYFWVSKEDYQTFFQGETQYRVKQYLKYDRKFYLINFRDYLKIMYGEERDG